jgi:hypothetical protein
MKQLAIILSIYIISGCASPDYQSAITRVPKNDCRNKLIHLDQIERELAFTRPIPFFQKEHNERIYALKDTYWTLQYNCSPV